MYLRFVVLVAFAISVTWAAKTKIPRSRAETLCLKAALKKDPKCAADGGFIACVKDHDGKGIVYGGGGCENEEFIECVHKRMGLPKPVYLTMEDKQCKGLFDQDPGT